MTHLHSTSSDHTFFLKPAAILPVSSPDEESSKTILKWRRTTEKFRRQKNCVFNKAKQLSEVSDADVFIFVARNERWYTYSSSDHPGFPPSKKAIIWVPSMNRLLITLICGDRKSTILLWSMYEQPETYETNPVQEQRLVLSKLIDLQKRLETEIMGASSKTKAGFASCH